MKDSGGKEEEGRKGGDMIQCLVQFWMNKQVGVAWVWLSNPESEIDGVLLPTLTQRNGLPSTCVVVEAAVQRGSGARHVARHVQRLKEQTQPHQSHSTPQHTLTNIIITFSPMSPHHIFTSSLHHTHQWLPCLFQDAQGIIHSCDLKLLQVNLLHVLHSLHVL